MVRVVLVLNPVTPDHFSFCFTLAVVVQLVEHQPSADCCGPESRPAAHKLPILNYPRSRHNLNIYPSSVSSWASRLIWFSLPFCFHRHLIGNFSSLLVMINFWFIKNWIFMQLNSFHAYVILRLKIREKGKNPLVGMKQYHRFISN